MQRKNISTGTPWEPVLEVIDALMEAYGIQQEEVFLARDEKRAEKGDFQEHTELVWTEENP